MSYKEKTGVRIAVVISIVLLLVLSRIHDRKNIPAINAMNAEVRSELLRAEYLKGIVGPISAIEDIDHQSDSIDGEPAFRLVKKLTADEGTFTAYVDVVREGKRWKIFDLTLVDSDDRTIRVIQDGGRRGGK